MTTNRIKEQWQLFKEDRKTLLIALVCTAVILIADWMSH